MRVVPGSHSDFSIDRAPRWCGAWETCGACFLLCVVCLGVQGMVCGKLAPLCFSFRCCCAMRWCEAGEICSTVRISLLCVGCSDVQECTATELLRCAFLSAVAAQCALWVRGGKCSVLSNRNKCSASFAAHNTLTATQCSVPHASLVLHQRIAPATAKREVPQNKFAAVHPRTLKQSTHNKKRTPYCTSAGATGGATQCHFRTNLQTRNITPRTSAKRGQ